MKRRTHNSLLFCLVVAVIALANPAVILRCLEGLSSHAHAPVQRDTPIDQEDTGSEDDGCDNELDSALVEGGFILSSFTLPAEKSLCDPHNPTEHFLEIAAPPPKS